MLTAVYNHKTLYIHEYTVDFLKKVSNEKALFCPDCGDQLIFKNYNDKQNHFAHLKKDCSYPFREPESIEHLGGKTAIFEWLKTQYNETDCVIERKIDITNQRSDTFVESLNVAVEFQCSPIQSTTWMTRNKLYKKANVNDIWVLGYSMYKPYLPNNPFTHKLNSLEETLLKEYGKIIYFDVLTKQFVFLYIEDKVKNYYIGNKYFFKMDEVSIQNLEITSKYDFFIQMQKRRKEFLDNELKKAAYTDEYLKNLKGDVEAEKILATDKQIKYIKYLLYKKGKKIPYKLHGLLKDEAATIITKLLEE